MYDRAAIDVEDLLKVVLVLVVIWLAIQILEDILGVLLAPFAFLQPILGLLIVILIVLWLLDKI